MKPGRKNRWLALALCLCLLASVFPLSGVAYAAEAKCSHEHDTAVCGYKVNDGETGREGPLGGIEAVEGQPCTFAHEHDDACGYTEAKEAVPCAVEVAHTIHDEACGGDPATGEGCAFTHEHDDACGWAEAKESAPCAVEAAHTVHDAAVCGYKVNDGEAGREGPLGGVEAVAGAPCSHEHDADCGGLQAEPLPCALTEGCTLEDGHEGKCVPALPGASQRDAGYVWDSKTNKLTVTTNEGTTAWREAIKTTRVYLLEIGDQVTAIGDNAFLGCGNLENTITLTLPAGLKSIGDNAFRHAYVENVVIPAGVEHIGEGAFASERIKTIQVEPENQHFTSVDNVLYSKSMDTLYAYPKNKAGADVTIPDSVERIGNWTFYLYTSLETVQLPAGLKSIGDYAFSNCIGLQSVDLSGCAGLTSIGDWAFEGCPLTSVQLPEGLKSIGERAFWGGRFQSVDIPAGVEHIGEGAFVSPVLEAVRLDPGNRHFISIDNVLYNAAMDTLYCYPAKKTGAAFLIPDSVKRIGDSAFRNCKSLTSVALPAGLKSIGQSAFSRSGLQSADLSGCAGLTTIEDGVFRECYSLTSVALPSGLKSIGQSAFNSSGLQSVDLSGCAGLASIGRWAFRYCQSLTRVTFPSGLKSIGEEAFYSCNSLESMTFPAGLKSIGASAFYSCSGMTTIRFTGDVPPKIDLFGPYLYSLTEIYYPAGARGYMDDGWRSEAGFSSMTFIEIYRLTVERGVDETGGSPYDPGDRVTITADTGPGKTFAGWRGGDDSVFAEGSREDIRTTIIMPPEHLTLTAGYAEDEIAHSHSYGDWQHDDTHHWRVCSCGDITDKAVHDLGDWVTDKKPTDTDAGSRHRDCNTCGYGQTESIAPTGPDYEYRTLTDPSSGVQVSGLFTSDAALEVKEVSLHAKGDCAVCDDLRQRQEKGEVMVLFDISLKSGKYKGELDVEIPVGEQYNGQTAIMLHCKDKALESRTVTVSGGVARGTFSSLSPYAVAKVPRKTAITVNSATIPVNSATIPVPQTGDTTNMLPWVLLMLAALLGCSGLLVYRRLGYKKRP